MTKSTPTTAMKTVSSVRLKPAFPKVGLPTFLAAC